MIVRRLAAVTGAVLIVGLSPALAARPALAHGAPVSPISRTAACAAGGGLKTGTAACKAALAANGGPFGTFDNLRVPNVDGDDRKFVPDGHLCSGGLDAFKGLDIARDDFPATTVTGGRSLAVQYEATLPHEGSFRVYLTKQGYSPEKKLAWSDLTSTPIAEVKNPPLTGGSYRFSVPLPADRTGRQMLYVVWQTSSTVDTYYSCSDLVFTSGATATTAAAATNSPKHSAAPSKAAAPAPTATATSETAATSEPPAAESQRLTPVSDNTKVTLGHQIILGALVLAVVAAAWASIGWLRRKRFERR